MFAQSCGSQRRTSTLLDDVVFDHRRKAVRTQKQPVAAFERHLVNIGKGSRIAAKRSGDDAALGMHAGLFFGDFARFNHVGHERMVARDALKVAAMQQVGARIANLRHHEANSVDHGGGHGGSHALFAAPVDRGANNRAIRFDHGARKRIAVGGVGRVFDKRLDGDFAGDLACRMAAHAVGDGEYGWSHGQAVFVVVANQADVGTRTVFGEIDLGVAAAALGLLLRRPLFVPHSHGNVADIDHIAALERDRFGDALAVYGSAVR